MKATKIIGLNVVDKAGIKVGKISNVELRVPREGNAGMPLASSDINVLSFECSEGLLKKKFIFSVGEYVLLNVKKNEISSE
ncbi:MAG: hypothetical protein CVT89_02565 [Candidatus Altiarchaeales archaeon HGW-Altiarchaeales-2]|nr:MAG: hypothetical protein CVT89_02565 [Candidatus Altiarchaeales archaeon HGW-Altiarchaeales-2]